MFENVKINPRTWTVSVNGLVIVASGQETDWRNGVLVSNEDFQTKNAELFEVVEYCLQRLWKPITNVDEYYTELKERYRLWQKSQKGRRRSFLYARTELQQTIIDTLNAPNADQTGVDLELMILRGLMQRVFSQEFKHKHFIILLNGLTILRDWDGRGVKTGQQEAS